MRSFAVALVASLLAAGAARALQPCPASCHLGQGQPLFLVDADAVLITRCNREKSGAGSRSTCVTEQLTLDGKPTRQLPQPRSTGPDEAFTREHLDGHRLVQLAWQEPWPVLTAPYSLSEPVSHQRLGLTLDKSQLRCAAPGLPVVTRDFGCVPKAVHVFAITGIDKPPRRPVIVVGVCRTATGGEREVVVACAAAESSK